MTALTCRRVGGFIASRYATIGAGLAVLLVVVFNIEPSSLPVVGPYSYFKAAILAGLSSLIVYLAASFGNDRLQRLHHFIAYGVLCNIVLIELSFRLFPSLVPPKLLALLPTSEHRRVADDLGLMTEASFQGNGLLYSFRPNADRLNAYPWVAIDQDGFRNPSVPKDWVDVVLFGDSVTFARHARKDLGDLLRDQGISAYNLGMGGYSPFHYRDAYRRYVIDRGLPHGQILIFASFGGTDFADATKYAHVDRGGGDWRDYLGEATAIGPEWPDHQPFWTMAIAARLPAYLRTQLSDIVRGLDQLAGDKADVVLRYATLSVTPQILDLPLLDEFSEGWHDFSLAIDDVVKLAEGANAKVAIILMPNSGLLYRDSISGMDDFKRSLDARYRTIVGLMDARYRPRGVTILSMAAPLARAVVDRPIAAGPLDFHFNAEGWTVIRDELVTKLGLNARRRADTRLHDLIDASGS